MLPAHISQKKLLILGSVLLVLLAILFFIFTRQQRTPTSEVMIGEETGEEQLSVNPATSLPVTEVPPMTFTTYEAAAADSLTVPSTVKSYTFNSGFSLPFVSLIGQKLGLQENKQETNTVLLYNSPESNNPAYLQLKLYR